MKKMNEGWFRERGQEFRLAMLSDYYFETNNRYNIQQPNAVRFTVASYESQ